MEIIQAFLFTSKYILGRNGNTDIFYLFAAFAAVFYLWKRHDKMGLIIKLSIPFAIICTGMSLIYPNINVLCCGIFLAKMFLNITLMVFVAYNCKKWRINRFLEVIVWIHITETVFALLLRDSSLWVNLELANGTETISRLRLFYMDANSMAFSCGLIIVILVYQMLTEEVIWKQVLGIIVMLVDLFLSYGLSGIFCSLLATIAMLVMAYISKIKDGKGKQQKAKKYGLGILTILFITIGIFALNPTYFDRINAIIKGTDSVLYRKIIDPINNIGQVLKETHLGGVGFGNANTYSALEILNSAKAYPNSFIRIIAEGGIFGILLVIICVFGLGYYSFKYGKIIDKAMYVYIVLSQLIGGYFTDPTNFFVYGWIIGECLYNKIELTGTCRIKIFEPQMKEKLSIGMIGHKRVPSREGGVEIVVEEISKRLIQRGNNVDVYNRRGQHISGAKFNIVDYDNITEYEGIKIIKIPTIQRKGIAALIYSFLASICVVGKDYDIVHYHAEGPCAFIWIPSLFGIKTVATIHGLDWQRSGKWGSIASNFIRFGERMAVEFADEIIVLSRHMQQYFLDTYNRKTVLIPNGVNEPQKREADIITKKWGIKKDDYFLALSRITKEKCIDLLIKAFKEIRTEKKLVIAGGSSDSDSYVKELHDLAKDDPRIIFTGFVQGEEMEELFSNAYVYCLPSELEGMPLSLLEAMSYGNCCLTSDITECTDVVKGYGLFFSTNDKDDLVRSLQDLAKNSELVNKYKEKSASYICQKYKWDDVVDRTLEVYNR